jgi:hypothetical protein
MMTVEIGTCTAIVGSISTTRDGGYKLTLELNPEDRQVINQLMDRFGLGKKVIELGILGVEEGGY